MGKWSVQGHNSKNYREREDSCESSIEPCYLMSSVTARVDFLKPNSESDLLMLIGNPKRYDRMP